MRSPGYGSTEAWIGPAYNPLVLDQFKLCDKSIFEFLDVSKSDSISALAQLVGFPVDASLPADSYRSGRLSWEDDTKSFRRPKTAYGAIVWGMWSRFVGSIQQMVFPLSDSSSVESKISRAALWSR